jgi:predicted ATPase/DNA-binding SARP family transcriptional activator
MTDRTAGQPSPTIHTAPEAAADQITFCMLGPLSVWRGGEPVALPAPTSQRLLAALLLSDGPLGPDQLAVRARGSGRSGHDERTWAQVAVYRLRQWLIPATAGSVRVELGSRGYLVDLGSAQTDAALFRAWCADARAEADPVAQVALALRALGIWRGDVLPGSGDAVRNDPAAVALRQLRLDAACLLAAAALKTGAARDALPYVAELAQLNPLDERLQAGTAQLLAADGRQAQALRLIDSTVARLAEDLGVDPSPQLREAHLLILRDQTGDEARSRPAGGTVAPTGQDRWTGPRPWLQDLRGRAADRGGVMRLLHHQRLVTITGAGGIGKTTLALDVADRLSGQYPGGVSIVTLDDVSSAADLDDVLGAAGLDDVARFGDQPALLVLDNCEHLVDSVPRVLRTIYRRSAEITVLATSRRALGVQGEAVWRLSGLGGADPGGIADAVAVFTARIRAAGHFVPDSATELADIAELCRTVQGVPLALNLAADMAVALSPRELLRRLREPDPLPLAGSSAADPRHRSLDACTEWSYRLLSLGERTLLSRLSMFGEPFTMDGAAALGGGEPVSGTAVAELIGLVGQHLVEPLPGDGVRHYRLPYAVHQFARERFVASSERPDIYDRYLDYVLAN